MLKLSLVVILISMVNVLTGQVVSIEKADKIEFAIDSIEPPVPNITPLFKYHLRDVAVCKGPGETYYLTGTTDDNWGVADGIRVWESTDLKNWELLGEDGFVWTFDRDASNERQKKIIRKMGRLMRGIWAPEIHYINQNFWITYSVSNDYGSGLLRSISGKPEGPYVDVYKDSAMVDGIDATLFKDENGTVWYIWGPGKMKPLKPDMLGFKDDNPPVFPKDATGKEVGYEGVNMYFNDGKYYLMAAEWNTEGPKKGHLFGNTDVNRRIADGRYDCMIAMSDHLEGPYNEAYIAIPHGGHNLIFDDFEGNIWATLFGNDAASAPFRENPAIVKMVFDDDKKLVPYHPFPLRATNDMPVIYVDNKSAGGDGSSWNTAMPSLQKAIESALPGSAIWIASGVYNETLRIKNKSGLYFYGGFMGNEKNLSDRNPLVNKTIINGAGAPRVINIKNSEYLRLDGLTVTGGNATGDGKDAHGAGIYIDGCGELIRIVNSTIKDNFALGNGAGVYATNGASPLFINCVISGNEAMNNGGAIYVDCNAHNGYHTRFYNCLISENKAQSNGGVAYFTTNLKQTGLLRFISTVLVDNFTLLEGGNIIMKGGASLLMSYCAVVNNKGMSKGAAVGTLGSVPGQSKIYNNYFSHNSGHVLFSADAYTGVDNILGHPKNWTEVKNNIFDHNSTQYLFGFSYKTTDISSVSVLNTNNWAEKNIVVNANSDAGQKEFCIEDAVNLINKNATPEHSFPYDFKGDFWKN